MPELTDNAARILESVRKTGRNYNLHSHTQFCDGRAPMREMAKAASESGFRLYGFTPHSPICVESPCNMNRQDVPVYLDEVFALRNIYEDCLLLPAGMEVDYVSRDFGPHIDYFRNLPLDYTIGSVHFIPSKENIPVDIDGSYERFNRHLHTVFDNDLRYVAEKYFEQVLMMIESGGFDILGHLDKVAGNVCKADPELEHQHWYSALIEDVIESAVCTGVLVEINTKTFDSAGRFFPAEKWWPLLKEKRASLVINSDAHYPDLVNAGRTEAFIRLDPEVPSAE